MALRPVPSNEDISVVVVGALNPAIFHPEWFARQELLAPGEAEQAKIQVVSPQLADINFIDFGLQVLPNRLTVRTLDVSRGPKINDLIIAILTKLPHTPLKAAGINNTLHFAVSSLEDWHKIGDTLAPKDVWRGLYEEPGMAAISIQSPIRKYTNCNINIVLQPSMVIKPGVFVASNFDFQNSDERSSPSQIIDFFTAEWTRAVKEARKVAEHIIEKIL